MRLPLLLRSAPIPVQHALNMTLLLLVAVALVQRHGCYLLHHFCKLGVNCGVALQVFPAKVSAEEEPARK